jgi:hypothetical protein
MFLRNVGLTFNGLHDIISQKIELSITTGVTTSNPAFAMLATEFRVGFSLKLRRNVPPKRRLEFQRTT